MFKKVSIVSLAFSSILAYANPIGVVEYDYDKVNSQSSHSNYGAVGIIFPFENFALDVFAQGSSSFDSGVRDNLHGAEVGISKFVEYNSVNFIPRIAIGTMQNINFGEYNGNAKYALLSLEAQKYISEKTTGFISISHMNGLNLDAISASNRIMFGADYKINNKFTARIGYSLKRQLNTTYNGIVVMGFYQF